MKIKSLSTTSNFFNSINFDDGKNIHFIAGYCSKIVLDLLRLMTLDYDDQERMTTLKFDYHLFSSVSAPITQLCSLFFFFHRGGIFCHFVMLA